MSTYQKMEVIIRNDATCISNSHLFQCDENSLLNVKHALLDGTFSGQLHAYMLYVCRLGIPPKQPPNIAPI